MNQSARVVWRRAWRRTSANIVPMAKRVLSAAVGLGVLLLAMYLSAWQPHRRPLRENLKTDAPPVEPHVAVAITATQPIVTIPVRESGNGATGLSLDERSAGIKRRISDAIASRYHEQYVETLVGEGLSRLDSANIVQTLLDGCRVPFRGYLAALRGLRTDARTVRPRCRGGLDVARLSQRERRYDRKIRAGVRRASRSEAGMPIAIEANGGATASFPEDFGILAQPNIVAEPRSAKAATCPRAGPSKWKRSFVLISTDTVASR